MYDKIKNDIEVVNHKDEIISLYTPSSITPGENPIYMIVNILAQREYQNMNGHCLSRLELDLDYQPRIIYENILISRERWRISKKELDFIDNSESINKQADSFIQFANLLVEKKIPTNFFIYTDSYFKPSFI